MGNWFIGFCLGLAISGTARAQLGPDASPGDQAYDALRAKDYDRAIADFRLALVSAPENAPIRKDLAYTLLKVGETEAARDQFAEAMRLDPQDDQVALEYAYLCYETQEPAEARRIFDRLKNAGNAYAAYGFRECRPASAGRDRAVGGGAGVGSRQFQRA